MTDLALDDLPEDVHEQLADQPPSSKYIYAVLRESDGLTRREIQDATLIPKSTVRKRLARLRGAGLVSYSDTHKHVAEWYVTEQGEGLPQNGPASGGL